MNVIINALYFVHDGPKRVSFANEVAVQAFLDGRLDFLGIARVTAQVLACQREVPRLDLKGILQQDAWARSKAEEVIACRRSCLV